MAVSVIMPAYNSERFIGEAIQSVLNQTLQDWELIVVDDCSTDRTVEIVKSFTDPRIRLIRMPENSGPAAARLAGTKAAKFDFIYYFDSDDRLCPRALEVLGGALETAPDAVAAYAGFARIDENGRRYGTWRRFLPVKRPSGDVLEAQLKGNLLTTGSAIFRREAVLDSECWNPRLRNAEDWAAWAVLSALGRFIYVPRFKALEYRELSSGLSRGSGGALAGMMRSAEAVFNDPRVAGRIPPSRLGRLHRRREAHLLTYAAMLKVRERAWTESLSYLKKALWKSPRGGPVNILRYLFAIVDVFC